jgi:NitT/TauT family transport system ATP-binding protein
MFRQHFLAYVPLAARIRRVLDDRPGHRAPTSRFQEELEDYMGEDDAKQTLRAIVSWGRYAEAFAHDQEAGVFSLEAAR